MACSYTDEPFSSSMSMQSNTNHHYTLPLLPPPSDSFLSLQLADYIDNQQQEKDSLSISNTTPALSSPPPSIQTQHQIEDAPSDDDSTATSPLLWVPADRHPEIAPSEFAHWLETNGSNNVARKTSLRRKSSVLSNIHIPLEESDPTNSTPPHQFFNSNSSSSLPSPPNQSEEKQQGTPLEFDRHSPVQDTSRVLAPRGNRSLLRRSAFSARGRGRKQTSSRHGQNSNNSRHDDEPTTLFSIKKDQLSTSSSSLPATKNNNKTTVEPVRLYDRPVSMSEWIDLGSASLVSASDDSQHGILSRVHDAESNLLSQYDTTTTTIPLNTAVSNGIQERKIQDEATALSPPSLPTINEPNITFTPLSDEQQQHTIPSITSDTPPTKDLDIMENSSSLDEVTLPPQPQPPSPLPMTTTKKSSSRIQRASSERLPNKQERKSNSWFGGLFGDKDKKRGSLRRVEDERQAQHQRHEGEKHISTTMDTPISNNRKSGLGSLFSRSKSEHKTNNNNNKRHHLQKLQHHVIPGTSQNNTNGKTASSLRQQHHGDEMTLHGYRLPIHVERAIYRLSHFKLADPRRPLHHQVAISNLMFWYLGVINAQQQQQQQQLQQHQQQANSPPTLINTSSSQQQQQQSPFTNTNINTAPLQGHFDETATQLSPHDQKGQKTGRIVPKSRPMNNFSKGSLTTEQAGVTSQEQLYQDNGNELGKSDSRNDDDDLPLSYYKQS